MIVKYKKAKSYKLDRQKTSQKSTQYVRHPKLVTAGSALLIMIGIVTSNMLVSYAGVPSQPDGSNRRPVAVKQAPKPPAVKAAAVVKAAAPVKTVSTVINLAPPNWIKYPLYTETANDATAYYQANPTADGAALINREGMTPIAHWFGDWDPDIRSAANNYVAAAAQAGTVPVLVLYNIPQRDCGSYSAGGATSAAAYTQWVQAVAAGIGNRTAVIILEPDALAGSDCLSAADQSSRYSVMSQAVSTLKANPNAAVYLDAGNPGWQTAAVMAQRLSAANIAQADGFSLNVSNFITTARNQSYGDQLSKLVGGKHYVIDTSRNGNGNLSPENWCNTPGAALGSSPTVNTGDPLNDALLWVKVPWESDGSCSGAPAAGTPYWPFAAELARNAGWQ